MHKLLLPFAAVCGALALLTGCGNGGDKVRIAVDVPYEPFQYTTPDGELTGFEIELGNAVCAEMRLDCEWVIQSWDGIIPGLLSRKYDVIFSSMSINAERARQVLFSEPYYTTPSGWFVRENYNLNVNNMSGVRIGVQRGTVQDTYVTEMHSNTAQIRRYATADDLALDLAGDRIDAVFLDVPVGVQTILSRPGFKQFGDNVTEPTSIFGQGVGAAFRQTDTELANAFNEGLRRVKANGTYKRIMDRYFDFDIML